MCQELCKNNMDKYYERNPTTAAAVPLPLSGEARKEPPKASTERGGAACGGGVCLFRKSQIYFYTVPYNIQEVRVKGSHYRMSKGDIVVFVPHHHKELGKGITMVIAKKTITKK